MRNPVPPAEPNAFRRLVEGEIRGCPGRRGTLMMAARVNLSDGDERSGLLGDVCGGGLGDLCFDGER